MSDAAPMLHLLCSRTRNKDFSPSLLPLYDHHYPHPAKKPYGCPSLPFENPATTRPYIPTRSAPPSTYSNPPIPAPSAPAGSQSTLDSKSGVLRGSVAPSFQGRRWWKSWRMRSVREHKLPLQAVLQTVKWTEGWGK